MDETETADAAEVHLLPVPHTPRWMRCGVGSGTGVADVLWADYEECWCGLIREVANAE